jgi:23S rRNA (cytidine2498-2'-O)-methyltransferase
VTKEIPLSGAVYQAVSGFEDHLAGELDFLGLREREQRGVLTFCAAKAAPDGTGVPPVFWAANIWLEPFRLEFDSISEAAGALRAKQRNWAALPQDRFRRSALISEKLPPLPVKKREFPWLLPETPMGAFTLLDDHTLVGSARCTSPFPNGRIAFAEDREGPPSRAYLKLWEALVRARRWPMPGETCLDAGASPGGWSWALAKLGAKVIAVDRAPLEARVLEMRGTDGAPLVRFMRHDAFTLKPEDIGPVDWLFCDVICYPRRLYRWIEAWRDSALARNFVCTIKMQGAMESGDAASSANADADADADATAMAELGGAAEGIAAARDFAQIPGSAVMHLCHNKHELTWINLAAE